MQVAAATGLWPVTFGFAALSTARRAVATGGAI